MLIVEDDDLVRETMKEVIEDAGLPVDIASNGQEAIHRVRATRPCLILLDLMMPVMNGWDFLAWLRKQPEPLASTPVTVVSAAERDRIQPVSAAYQGVGHLEKPIQLDDLLAVVAPYRS